MAVETRPTPRECALIADKMVECNEPIWKKVGYEYLKLAVGDIVDVEAFVNDHENARTMEQWP